jgi:peptide/nickel transport system ATP-binding protein
MILRLARPTTGTITYDGADVASHRGSELKAYYARVQGVFQDPFSSFNPIFKADRVFSMIHREFFPAVDGETWQDRLLASLRDVGLNPADVLAKYPHELSGGQLQRLLIARALLLDIDLLVADEVISMLDASTRIDVLNLIGDLKARGLAVVFITHDLSLGHYISDSSVILRRGRVVERGPTTKVFGDPRHAYTRMLLESVPRIGRHWSSERRTEAPAGAAAGPLVAVDDDHFVAVEEVA